MGSKPATTKSFWFFEDLICYVVKQLGCGRGSSGSMSGYRSRGPEFEPSLRASPVSLSIWQQLTARMKSCYTANLFPLPFLPALLLSDLLAFISALTGFHNWGLVTRWAQLLITSLTATNPAHQKIKIRWGQSWQSATLLIKTILVPKISSTELDFLCVWAVRKIVFCLRGMYLSVN